MGNVSINCLDAARVFLKYSEKSQMDVFCCQLGKYKCHPDSPPCRATKGTGKKKHAVKNRHLKIKIVSIR